MGGPSYQASAQLSLDAVICLCCGMLPQSIWTPSVLTVLVLNLLGTFLPPGPQDLLLFSDGAKSVYFDSIEYDSHGMYIQSRFLQFFLSVSLESIILCSSNRWSSIPTHALVSVLTVVAGCYCRNEVRCIGRIEVHAGCWYRLMKVSILNRSNILENNE